jgi:hypothetical protein
VPSVALAHLGCHDPHRWAAVAQCVGADAKTTAGDDVEPELPALQLASDDPAVGCRLPAPAGDPGFKPADPAAAAQQDAGVGFGHGTGAINSKLLRRLTRHKNPENTYHAEYEFYSLKASPAFAPNRLGPIVAHLKDEPGPRLRRRSVSLDSLGRVRVGLDHDAHLPVPAAAAPQAPP